MDRWKSIKCYFKLNNNIMSKQWGQEGYDPCTKYNFIYKCLVANINYLTLVADGDGTINEFLWGFGGYKSKACIGLMGNQVNKGGQTTLFYDIYCHYPCMYIHCHKLKPRPQGFSAQGPSEVFDLVKSIEALVANTEPNGCEQVVIPNPTRVGKKSST